MTFERAAWEPDALTVFVEIEFLSALRAPFAIGFQWPHGKHDVSVRIAVAFVMNGKVRTHPGCNKVVPDIGADKDYLFLTIKFHR